MELNEAHIMLPIEEYSENTHFAFVEAIQQLDAGGGLENRPGHPPFEKLISNKKFKAIGGRTYSVWLDCVHAKSLAELPWIAKSCSLNSPSDAKIRKENINSLRPEIFSAVLILLNDQVKKEKVLLQTLQRSQWHRFESDVEGGLSALQATDLELDAEDTAQTRVGRPQPCTEDELKILLNVFNLSFILDLGQDDEEPDPEDDPNPEDDGPLGGGPKPRKIRIRKREELGIPVVKLPVQRERHIQISE